MRIENPEKLETRVSISMNPADDEMRESLLAVSNKRVDERQFEGNHRKVSLERQILGDDEYFERKGNEYMDSLGPMEVSAQAHCHVLRMVSLRCLFLRS